MSKEADLGQPVFRGTKPVVGVVGLGAVGGGLAASLLRNGFALVVNDLRPEVAERYRDRATVADSPADLVRQSEVVLVAVVDDAQVRSVLSGEEGGLAAARPGTIVVVVSTISMSCIDDIGREAADLGVVVVDCGVSGGPSAADEGDLVCMIGGDEEAVANLQPVFDAIGSLAVLMGPLGSGLAAKIARNLVQYGSWLAAYEGQRLAEAAGIELPKLATVIKASDALVGGASTLMFRQTVAPFTEEDDANLIAAMRSACGLARKDLRAALDLASSFDVDLPLAKLAERHCDDVFGIGTVRGHR